MNMDIRPPFITGKTVGEQVRQLIAYLTRLARQLREMQAPQSVAVREVSETANRTTFQKLRVQKNLTVDGGVNGIYVNCVRLWGTGEFNLKTRFSNWSGVGDVRQSFLLAGCMDNIPLLGVLRVSNNGGFRWEGTEGLTFTPEPEGIMRIKLPVTLYDYLMIQSPQKFNV